MSTPGGHRSPRQAILDANPGVCGAPCWIQFEKSDAPITIEVGSALPAIVADNLRFFDPCYGTQSEHRLLRVEQVATTNCPAWTQLLLLGTHVGTLSAAACQSGQNRRIMGAGRSISLVIAGSRSLLRGR